MSEKEKGQILSRLAQMNRDLLFLVKQAERRGFALEDEVKQMRKLRQDIRALKSGGDFIYDPGGDE